MLPVNLNAKLFIFKTKETIFIQTEKLRHYGKKKVQENMNHKTVKVMYEALRLCGHKVLDEHLQFGFTT